MNKADTIPGPLGLLWGSRKQNIHLNILKQVDCSSVWVKGSFEFIFESGVQPRYLIWLHMYGKCSSYNPNKNLVYVHVSTHVLGIWEVSHGVLIGDTVDTTIKHFVTLSELV